MDSIVSENVSIGGVDYSFAQLSGSAFINVCHSSNLSGGVSVDSTGLRIYGGAHVACRFVELLNRIFVGKKVCEIGCGTGLLGLFIALKCSSSSVLLTDGNGEALNIAHINSDSIKKNVTDWNSVSFLQLSWGSSLPSSIIQSFDIVVGSELMYYSTDLHSLVDTVRNLLVENGVFIHAHIFRRDDQESELIELFHRIGFRSYELPITDFISEEERRNHPEWYKVRCLITAPYAVVDQILVSFADIPFIPFEPQPREVEEEDDTTSFTEGQRMDRNEDEETNGCSMRNLFRS